MGFDVTVNQARAVGVAESGTGLDEEGDGFFNGEAATLFNNGFEVGAGDMFHDDEQASGVVAEVVDGDDVGVGEVGGSFGFLAETFAEGRVTGEGFSENLNRHSAFKHEVVCFIDDGHAAFADAFFEGIAVIEQGGVLSHGRRILSWGR